MNSAGARTSSASVHRIKHLLLGNVCVLAVSLALALGTSPASAAKSTVQHKRGHKETARVSKEPFGNIAKGPLQIFISINQQRLHFYSGGVHVVDEPVATGVPGHLTPMGVFSVIERDRYHHSNIYAGAPMPFMERITWSGVALHEGVGLGHPASHGCIRMPHDFAARLWQLHTMGMRVIIARSELHPTEFADPHLFVHKDRPIASLTPRVRPVETAQTIQPGTTTDAADPAIVHTPQQTPAAPTQPASAAPTAEPVKTAEPAQTAPVKPATDPVTAGAVPAEPAQAPESKPDKPATAATAQPEKPATQPSEAPLTTATTPVTPPTPAKVEPAKTETVTVPAADLTAPVAATLEVVPLPLSKPVQAKSTGPIAIFVSRREHKIFVRQNFTPMFESPVTIDHPEQPLGTHVFTALDYMPDGSTFRWNVVTLPHESAKTVKQWKTVRDSRGHRKRVPVEEKVTVEDSPVTAQQALARIEIPKSVIDQISQLMAPGSSLVISDQGLGPETGQGTDFIVVTR